MKLSDSVNFATAKTKDALFFLKVRNQPAVREASFQTSIIKRHGHLEWYKRALRDKETALFVIHRGKKSAGTLRLNRVSSETAEIHLALLDSMRGQGVGTEAVRNAVKWAAKQKNWNIKYIQAHIKKENKASVRCFEKAGFKSCGLARVQGETCLRFSFKYLNLLTVIDAGQMSGLGHLMRQSVLARELSERGHRVTFAVKHLTKDRKHLKQFFTKMINFNIRWQPNSQKIQAQINASRHDAVIWDALAFEGYNWTTHLRQSGLPVFAVGNYPSVPRWVHYCVNPYTQTNVIYRKTKIQSSPAFCVLSDEFVEARSAMQPRVFKPASVSKLLVIPGGGNTNGMIFKIIQALIHMPATVQVTIVCGAFFTDMDKLKADAVKLKCKVVIKQNIPSSAMAQLMIQNDLALVSYGRSIDEARALGLPVLVLSSSALNAMGAKHAQKQGGIKYLGDFESLQSSKLNALILDWLNSPLKRKKLSVAGMNAVDGVGCLRTADWIERELAAL